MKLSRSLLHRARIADAVLFWPMLGLVVWGEVLAPQGFPLFAQVNDKLLHFLGYFALAWMAGAAFRERRGVGAAIAALILMGGALELVQGAAGREASLYDELANAAGALTGGALARLLVEPLRRRFAAKR